MCQPIRGKTAVYSSQVGQQMALQSAQTTQAMAVEDQEHVITNLRIQPITDNEPNFDQNHKERSHLG